MFASNLGGKSFLRHDSTIFFILLEYLSTQFESFAFKAYILAIVSAILVARYDNSNAHDIDFGTHRHHLLQPPHCAFTMTKCVNSLLLRLTVYLIFFRCIARKRLEGSNLPTSGQKLDKSNLAIFLLPYLQHLCDSYFILMGTGGARWVSVKCVIRFALGFTYSSFPCYLK